VAIYCHELGIKAIYGDVSATRNYQEIGVDMGLPPQPESAYAMDYQLPVTLRPLAGQVGTHVQWTTNEIAGSVRTMNYYNTAGPTDLSAVRYDESPAYAIFAFHNLFSIAGSWVLLPGSAPFDTIQGLIGDAMVRLMCQTFINGSLNAFTAGGPQIFTAPGFAPFAGFRNYVLSVVCKITDPRAASILNWLPCAPVFMQDGTIVNQWSTPRVMWFGSNSNVVLATNQFPVYATQGFADTYRFGTPGKLNIQPNIK
jgi:hypothetical protein